MATVECQACGVSVRAATRASAQENWNRIQGALTYSALPGLSVIISYRHDICDYAVRVGTIAQIDKPTPMEIGATCYRADNVKHSQEVIASGARRCRNAAGFIAWMAQGGVRLEACQ